MGTMTPRLLNREKAREYLGGACPEALLAPMRLGGRNVWDRIALDAALNARAGLAETKTEQQTEQGEGLERARQRIKAKKAQGSAG